MDMRPRPQVLVLTAGQPVPTVPVKRRKISKLCGTSSSCRLPPCCVLPLVVTARRHHEFVVLEHQELNWPRERCLGETPSMHGRAIEVVPQFLVSPALSTRGGARSRTPDWAGTSTDAGGSFPPAPLRNPRLSEVPRTVLGGPLCTFVLYPCTSIHFHAPAPLLHPVVVSGCSTLPRNSRLPPLLSVDDHSL